MCFLARIINGIPCVVCILLNQGGRYEVKVSHGPETAREQGFATHKAALMRGMKLARDMEGLAA